MDLAILLGPLTPEAVRLFVLFVLFDARYDPDLFPYRPHHYAYLHGDRSLRPPLYYAVNATMGGVPDRIGTTRFNHFETYLFHQRSLHQRSALMLGNPSRFATARAEVAAFYDVDRVEQAVELPPKAHAEVPLAAEHAGRRLRRVDLKAPFRLTSYVVGHDGISGDLSILRPFFLLLQVSADAIPEALNDSLLCYCADLTYGELRQACREGRWPLPGRADRKAVHGLSR